jgi:hypothetical protein
MKLGEANKIKKANSNNNKYSNQNKLFNNNNRFSIETFVTYFVKIIDILNLSSKFDAESKQTKKRILKN